MKLLVPFFFFLFCYFTGTAVHVYNKPQDFLSKGKPELAQEEVSSYLDAVFIDKAAGLNQDRPDFLLLEEDDDDNIIKTHIRKYFACFLDVFFPLSYDHLADGALVDRHLFGTNSSKYILQRVLRI